jgi:CO dehydrogenase maturation factor
MKIAIAGKGGSGKTTIAGILARLLAQRGHEVWAIDADSNPNLGVTIGMPVDQSGQRTIQLAIPPREVAEKFGLPVADRLTLLLMGTVDHAGAG